MDQKLKWVGALCAGILCLGLYQDFKPPTPLNFDNPATFRYGNILRHANNNVAAAQYVLGTFYLYGHEVDGIAKNNDKAKEWFKRAADNQHAPAAFEYGRLIAPVDLQAAEKYYRQAMAKGYTASIFALAQVKLHQATPEAIKEGLALLYIATKAKDPMALAYFSTLQYEGAGVEKDRVAAVLGMQQAAIIAPTEETKKNWGETQNKWLSELTVKEQEELNERLMLGMSAPSTSSTMPPPPQGQTPDLSALMADFPINSPKPVGK